MILTLTPINIRAKTTIMRFQKEI